MISINATLVVQVVNFLFAWWFLDRFFFRLFVREVQKEQATLSHLVSDVSMVREAVTRENNGKESKWVQYRKLFKKNIPQIKAAPHLSFSGVLCPVSLSLNAKKKKELLGDLQKVIVNKVAHDY